MRKARNYQLRKSGNDILAIGKRLRFARRKGGDFPVMVRTKGSKGTKGTKGRFTDASREEAKR